MREDVKAARQEWERWLQAESVDEETRGQLRAWTMRKCWTAFIGI